MYYTKQNGWYKSNKKNNDWWKATLEFVEVNIWEKWYKRCLHVKGNNYWYFLRGRTHMGADWAGIAMYLNTLTTNENIKKQTSYLVTQYDTLMKRNLKKYKECYVWNSTYDDVEGTYASVSEKSIIQDVSHGNHVISYIVASYELGTQNWNIEDIKTFSNTLKNIIYDTKTNTFSDNVDGTFSLKRYGWGNYIADGWVKLANYDEELISIFMEFSKSKSLKKYNQNIQFNTVIYLLDS